MKKKINFKPIEITGVDGSKAPYDISKELGNAIYAKTMDIGELELAREIYKNGEVEINEAQAIMISRIIRENFLASAQEALCPVLDNLFNNNQK